MYKTLNGHIYIPTLKYHPLIVCKNIFFSFFFANTVAKRNTVKHLSTFYIIKSFTYKIQNSCNCKHIQHISFINVESQLFSSYVTRMRILYLFLLKWKWDYKWRKRVSSILQYEYVKRRRYIYNDLMIEIWKYFLCEFCFFFVKLRCMKDL